MEVRDVVVVGGGPAGLSAALMLARCGRSVLVIDSGSPRNKVSTAIHGFLTRDGISPEEFYAAARRDVLAYGVEILAGLVTSTSKLFDQAFRTYGDDDAQKCEPRFRVGLEDGSEFFCHFLLLAHGVRDVLPAVTGIEKLYGTSVHHCQYCDAWQYRGKPLIAYGEGDSVRGLARSLRTWSAEVTACTNGHSLSKEAREALQEAQVEVRTEVIAALESDRSEEDGRERLTRIRFENGELLEADGLFFSGPQDPQNELPRQLNCELEEDGKVKVEGLQYTSTAGVFFAGDACRDVHFVIEAAAEGAKAAVAINKEFEAAGRWYPKGC